MFTSEERKERKRLPLSALIKEKAHGKSACIRQQ